MPTASARPPKVIRLIVSPSALRIAIELRTESGIDSAMISVLRQEPRNSRIISAVSAAAIMPSFTTSPIAAAHKQRLIGKFLHVQFRRQLLRIRGMAALTRLHDVERRSRTAL